MLPQHVLSEPVTRAAACSPPIWLHYWLHIQRSDHLSLKGAPQTHAASRYASKLPRRRERDRLTGEQQQRGESRQDAVVRRHMWPVGGRRCCDYWEIWTPSGTINSVQIQRDGMDQRGDPIRSPPVCTFRVSDSGLEEKMAGEINEFDRKRLIRSRNVCDNPSIQIIHAVARTTWGGRE